MTLIIGIKCRDGVAVGADSAATLGNPIGLSTVIQPMAKLNVIRDSAILATSGPVGLAQLHVDSVDGRWNSLREADAAAACRSLRDALRPDVEVCLKMSSLAASIMGQGARTPVVHSSVLAIAPKRRPLLIQFDYHCNPEVATDDLPFVSIGSGQPIADPFLAFLRHTFWKDRLPCLSEGILAIVWTLTHAIRTATGGIAGPIQAATLTIRGTQPEARLLTHEEIEEHSLNVGEAEKHLTQFRILHQPTADEPQPPQPPRPP